MVSYLFVLFWVKTNTEIIDMEGNPVSMELQWGCVCMNNKSSIKQTNETQVTFV